MTNPLLSPYNTPFESVPFNEIKLEHYAPAIKKGIQLGKEDIEKIKSNSATANFENTIEALERAGKMLDKATSVFFNLNSCETSDEMQQIAQEVSPLLSSYSDEILLDNELFKRVEAAVSNTDKKTLSKEQAMLLEKTYKSFVRNGAKLDDSKKEELKGINSKLSLLSLNFGENLLKDSNKFELWIDNDTDLAGLPEGDIEAARMLAEEKGRKDEWLFTLDYPSYIPFMTSADNRELRKKMFLAFGARAFQNNEYNNEAIVKEIVNLRHQKAQLLGYQSHADFVLEERMAQTPQKVYNLLDELLNYAKPLALKEIEELQAISDKRHGPNPIERWDFAYYSEKLKTAKFALNDEILKPYFQLENVIDGVFETAKRLYNITFEERSDIPKYHKDVITYQAKDAEGKHLSVFYADFFPRPSKRNGAWMTSFSGQNKYDGKEQRPLVSIVCNFTKPTTTKPSLLTFDEVTTLFHEFGHALHGMLADTHYESLSGTSVYWDFVELPSQIFENWCYEKECLDLFAKHYKTNEPIPMELVQKIKDSANFMSAYQTVRQVGLGKLDMAWHNLVSLTEQSIEDFEHEATRETSLFPKLSGVNTSCSFGHIFQGGYSAGYYSYKWAEVLEADAFEHFQETGIFNKETAQKFKDYILSKGGTEHPMTLYKKFRGQEPSTEPLLRKSGLLKK